MGSKNDHDLSGLINHYAFLVVKTTERESNNRIIKNDRLNSNAAYDIKTMI